MTAPRPRILHLHSSFDLGGKEARDVELMNAWGDRFEHVIVSSQPGALGAADLIGAHVPFRIARDAPPLAGRPSQGRLRALARYFGGFDLVLSFNFGAMDGVLANRLFARRPLVHHEDGFNADEVAGQKRSRVLYRRLALPGARNVVVPSQTLERIAASWGVHAPQLQRVPNGIDVQLFAHRPSRDVIPSLPDDGSVVVGTVAGLRPVKNLPLLVRSFARAVRDTPVPTRLVIVGRGSEEAAIRAAADQHGIADRVHLPGFLPHPHRYIGRFDVFALSSDSEQFPISLVEAMAAGLPAACTDVGDVRAIVTEENRAWLAPARGEAALARSLSALIGDAELRQRLGQANRARVRAEYSRDTMIARYEAIYGAALGRPT
jgi:glycosyltransferase involved in cell wall biosynthesis